VRILDDALLLVADVRSARNTLIAGSEGTVLDEWITRNRDYDTALQNLYAALRDADGNPRVPAVQLARVEERRAFERLPPDRRTIIVIVSEVTRGGLTEAVIAIEEARGRIEAALAEGGSDDTGEASEPPSSAAPAGG
jgi:hypothetical protein